MKTKINITANPITSFKMDRLKNLAIEMIKVNKDTAPVNLPNHLPLKKYAL